jgi:hypothetical protein
MTTPARILLLFCVVGVAWLAPIPAHAGNTCPGNGIEAEQSVIQRFQNWQDLFDSYSRFKDCDDGAIAEGWSDAVVHLLATHWDKLGELQALSRTHSDFEAFVLKHIDATTDSDELDRVGTAASHCPKSESALCEKIKKQVESAKAEMTE